MTFIFKKYFYLLLILVLKFSVRKHGLKIVNSFRRVRNFREGRTIWSKRFVVQTHADATQGAPFLTPLNSLY